MKVFLVEINNGEEYEDNRSWIEKVYTSFRSASSYLIKQGYHCYLQTIMRRERLEFRLEIDEFTVYFAEIKEKELED